MLGPCLQSLWATRISFPVVLAVATLLRPGLLVGQESPPALTPASVATSRDELYAQLAKDVARIEREGNILKRVVQLVTPSVVHIEAKKITPPSYASSGRSLEEAGAGVIIQYKQSFYVLTNRHVIKDSPLGFISINLSDGRTLHPTKMWMDDATDVAIMRIKAPGLTPARIGDSDKLEIGDFVLAFGSPFGLSRSVTYGIISAKGRRDLKIGDDKVRYQDFLQTDAAINPGNSGGPLLNLRAEVIGINTAIASSSGGSEGIGFTIPINMFMHVAKQLIEKGDVKRAYLGVRLDAKFDANQAIAMGLPSGFGARVSSITPGSPAESAKLQVDDVIVKLDGITIEDDAHLVNIMSLFPVGKEVTVMFYRDGELKSVQVTVGDREAFEPE